MKAIVKKLEVEGGVGDKSDSWYGPPNGSCEHGNGFSSSIKCG